LPCESSGPQSEESGGTVRFAIVTGQVPSCFSGSLAETVRAAVFAAWGSESPEQAAAKTARATSEANVLTNFLIVALARALWKGAGALAQGQRRATVRR
jgi:hypothetical protein